MGFLDEQQQQEQEQQLPESTGYLNPSLSPNIAVNQDFFLQRINNADTLEEIKNALSGIDFVPNDNGIGGRFEQVYSPMVKDKNGLNNILFLINSMALNKTKSFSRLEEERINFKCKKAKIALAKNIALYNDNYGIDWDNREFVLQGVNTLIHLSLMRCKDGIEAQQLSSANQQITHNINQKSKADEQKNLLSNLMFWRK